MTRFARASLTLKILLVAGHAMASANLFEVGDEVSSLSDSLLSKSLRIVGGVEAQEGRYPYVVSITSDGSVHLCGGSLIAKDTVLTAAHNLGGTIIVKIGGYEIAQGEGILVTSQVAHPSYDSSTNENDFALLFLEDSTTLDISLPQLNNNGDFPLPGSTTHVMGWGVMDDGDVADVLMRVDLGVISNEDCDNAELGDDNYNGQIYDDMICTESDGGQDACYGDSGGPLIVRDDNGPDGDVVVGVVSWGIGCGIMPGVFARVSSGYDWIQATVCETSNDPPGSLCGEPTNAPITRRPTRRPTTLRPTSSPTLKPTDSPTDSPTLTPSLSPTTSEPTLSPTESTQPTDSPSTSPTLSFQPTGSPSISTSPSASPSTSPSISFSPTTSKSPTTQPSGVPSLRPSSSPTLTSSPTISSTPTMSGAPTSVAAYNSLKSPRHSTSDNSVDSDSTGKSISIGVLLNRIISMWMLLL
ncbi:hypothetical protein ACHAW5_009451 [Stephanodiscus triporus]|uniref:Peptidase S1 domain-containing protein n=1 Tax=Stephanodiscus triporus TaxID=2934178 RepID=A0ABD3QYW2_9STRA